MNVPVVNDPHLPWSTRTANLSHFLTRNARRLPGQPALICGETVLTWAELNSRVSALSAALRDEFGVGTGDRVLVQSPNCFEIVETMLACFRLGAVWVPANFRQSPDEVAWLAEKSEVALMICDADFPDHASLCRDRRGGLPVLRTGGGDFGQAYEAAVSRHLGTEFTDAAVDRDSPCWHFFTSGTTGRPKAVVLTQGQLGFVIVNHLCDLIPGTTERDRSLVIAPLSHGAGMHFLLQLAVGAASVLMPPGRLDPAIAWQLVERHRITNMFTVPTIVKMLVDDPAVDRHDHGSLRHVIYAGAPMYRADQKVALRKLGKVLVQYFGLGEVTGCITVLPAEEHEIEDAPDARIGTCGRERTGMQVTIRDDAGSDLPPLATGEICVTGPGVCAGYYRNEEANGQAFRDGWFCTGDLGHMDAEGYLYITGRKSDMYISGGSNVYPREVEEVLLTHPDMAEVAIIGVPDPRWGEVGLAVCVAVPGIVPDEASLRAFVESRIARYKQPAHYAFLPEMPKTGYGKVTKKLLRETLAAAGLLPGAPR